MKMILIRAVLLVTMSVGHMTAEAFELQTGTGQGLPAKVSDTIECAASLNGQDLPSLKKSCVIRHDDCPLQNPGSTPPLPGVFTGCIFCNTERAVSEIDYSLDFEGTLYRSQKGAFIDSRSTTLYNPENGFRAAEFAITQGLHFPYRRVRGFIEDGALEGPWGGAFPNTSQGVLKVSCQLK